MTLRIRAPAVVAALLLASASARGGTIEFVYATANVGGASGGHAAIRFDEAVYHFQQREGGVVRLARTGAAHFLWTYAVLENRTLHTARLRASPETYELLRDRFNARFLAEEKQFAAAQALADDRLLLERWLAATDGGERPATLPSALPLPAAGLFDATTTEAPALAAVRDAVARRRGARYLDERRAAVESALARLRPSPIAPPADARAYPTPAAGLAERYGELALELVAIDTLAHARALRADVQVEVPGSDALLTAEERARLRGLRDRLAARLTSLVAGEGPGRGRALLVGMARLEAIDATIAGGRWVVVDAFPDAATTIAGTGADDADRRAFFEDLRRDAGVALARARRALVDGGDADEREYAGVEDAANRLAEVTRGLADGGPIRVRSDVLVPSRAAPAVDLPVPALTRDDVVAAIGAAERAERAQREVLATAYRYHLRRRNCVSEIFATIDEALGRDGSMARLGGWVDPQGGLVFWPWLAFRAVVETYDVDAVAEIPSYRRARLTRMYADESSLLAYLRETNTVTSTVYRATGDDAPFLFFTDDVVAPRPLYGAANLATGIAAAALGVVRSPFDGGRALWSGAKSVAFSVPELAFVNLRKGTMAYGRAALDVVRDGTTRASLPGRGP